MKKLVFLSFLLVLGMLISACAPSTPSQPEEAAPSEEEVAPVEEAAKDFVLAYDGVTSMAPYMALFNEYTKGFAEEAGITLLFAESGGDLADQLSTAENFSVQDIDVLAGIWLDLDGAIPVIDYAKDAGNIPVISVLTSLRDEGDGYENYIYLGSRNFDGGYVQGTWIAENAPEGAGLWVLNSFAGDQQGIDRVAGMLKGIEDSGRTDIKVVSENYTNNARDQGVTVMEDWLNTYDKIDVVVGTNDDTVLGAIEATKAADRMDEGILFIGLDGGDLALQSIKAGEMSMSVLQDAENQARALVDLVVQLRNGADPSAIDDVFVPFKIISPENVDEFIK